MYRRHVFALALMYTCVFFLNGCDPILEERKRNGLELEPFTSREYIRVQRNFVEELQSLADEMDQVEDAVYVQHRNKVYVGILSSQQLAKDTEKNVRQRLTEWVKDPRVEHVYVTYDANQAKMLRENPDISEEKITQYGWILLGKQGAVE